MQAFEGQLSDKELAAVVTYERNAWGNNTGDVVQPSFVAGVKDGKIEDPIAKKANKTEAK
jgi:cytochrome c oxidase subunit 2